MLGSVFSNVEDSGEESVLIVFSIIPVKVLLAVEDGNAILTGYTGVTPYFILVD